jgi:adenylate kinase
VIPSAAADAAAGAGSTRRIIILVGVPGAGKGTQAGRLADELGVPHVSTGELFRDAVRDKSTLGETVRGYLGRGALVPDEVTIGVVRSRLAEADAVGGAILDGFPRTRAQAEALDILLEEDHDRVNLVLYVEVGQDELVRRLSGRRVCSAEDQHVYHLVGKPPETEGICDIDGAPLEQRKDDQPETLRARLDRQMPPMFEVVDHYAERGILVAVAGEQPMNDVTADMLGAITKAARDD